MLFCTEGFDRLAGLMLDGVPAASVRVVRLPHPLAQRGEAEVEGLTDAVLAEVRDWLAAAGARA